MLTYFVLALQVLIRKFVKILPLFKVAANVAATSLKLLYKACVWNPAGNYWYLLWKIYLKVCVRKKSPLCE